MGCDIHCYMEYKPKGSDSWRGFGGRVNPGRNYWMFGTMAGVRADHLPHVEPRGVPADMASDASGDYWIFITEEGGEGYTTPERAASWCNGSWDRSVLKHPEKPLLNNFVSGPDAHTHSWLTPDEFELALAVYLKESGFNIGQLRLTAPEAQAEVQALATEAADHDKTYALSSITEYWAILQSLRCFEAQGHEARLVFWFDN